MNDFLNRLFAKKRNVYIFAILAIVVESFSSAILKKAGQYPLFSVKYLFWFAAAVAVMGIYAVAWQLVLEYLPLTTAYMRKGLTYVLIFVWAVLLFHESIDIKQIVGIVVIIIGIFVSVSGDKETGTL